MVSMIKTDMRITTVKKDTMHMYLKIQMAKMGIKSSMDITIMIKVSNSILSISSISILNMSSHISSLDMSSHISSLDMSSHTSSLSMSSPISSLSMINSNTLHIPLSMRLATI